MKYKVETLPLADHYVVAAKDPETGEVKETFTLNESGVDMLQLFCEGKDAAGVAQGIAEMYDAPVELVTKDVKSFEDKLKAKGFL